jgi:hypothetical protein
LLGSLAVGLAFLRAIDPAEADTFSVVVVQDFEGVTVEYADDGAGRKPKACQYSLQRIRYARIR